MESYTDEPLFSQFCRAIQADTELTTSKDAEDIAVDFAVEFANAWHESEEKDPIYIFNKLCDAFELGKQSRDMASLSLSKNERDDFFNMLYAVAKQFPG